MSRLHDHQNVLVYRNCRNGHVSYDDQAYDLLDHLEYEDSENNCPKYVHLQDVPGKDHDNHGTYDWLVHLSRVLCEVTIT